MIKRPFFGLAKPKLKYSVIEDVEKDVIKEIPLSPKVTLFLKVPDEGEHDLLIKVGDKVKTGQRFTVMEGREDYLVSSVTGSIARISPYTGYLGQNYTAISIDAAQEDEWDDEFRDEGRIPTRETALRFLGSFPGAPDFSSLIDFRNPVNTIVINGIDSDLLISTNQVIVKTGFEDLREGIKDLRKITSTSRIIIVVTPGAMASQVDEIGAQIKVIKPVYPNAFPKIIMKNILGRVPPAGKCCEEMGVGFISAEGIVALAGAFEKGEIPVNKVITVIDKDNKAVNVRVRIGTPVKDILKALDIETRDRDRLVLGGPMNGRTIHSEDVPVMYDTDAIMVQDKSQIICGSDSQCVNCGECVRICPVNIPVNMLIRLLRNGLYEEAAERYDLLSCVECGLCSYVCMARIPVFHYIVLGKHEFGRIMSVEESNA